MIANRIDEHAATVLPPNSGQQNAYQGFSLNRFRPVSFHSFIGQEHLKALIRTSVASSMRQNAPFPHSLLTGGAGLGKTSLAKVIAHERDVRFHPVSADEFSTREAVQKVFAELDHEGYDSHGRVAGPIRPGVLFLDEVHRLRREGQELLFSALEDRVFESTRKNSLTGLTEIKRLWIPCFTLIAATNRPGDLAGPFRDRLRLNLNLEPYPVEESALIAKKTLTRLGMRCEEACARMIALRSRGVPRRVINICLQVCDTCVARGTVEADQAACEEAFNALQIDPIGLNRQEIAMLKHLAASRRPVGINTLAAILGENEKAVESSVEPFLIARNLLSRSPRGRVITEPGLAHLRQHHGYQH